MKTSMALTRNFHSMIGKTLVAFALVGVLGGMTAGPARADDYWRHERYDRGEHEWREHEWRDRDWYGDRAYAVPPPAYIYAPPPVVYAPPPPPVAFFGLNLRFR